MYLSNLSKIRILLSLIIPSGMTWSYSGVLHSQISPRYQQIRMFEQEGVLPGAAGETRTLTPVKSEGS